MGFLRSRGGQITLAIGGVIALGLLIAFIWWVSVQGYWPVVRDIALVALAVVTFVPLLALAYAVLELVRTARTISKELVPVLNELKETTHSVRQTAKVANDFTVKPAVKTAGFLMGFSQAASIILGPGNARKRQDERRRRAAEAAHDEQEAEMEADHVAG
jgi:hypothetical protein